MLKPFCAMAGALALVVLPGVSQAQTTVNSSRAGYVSNSGLVSTRSTNGDSQTGTAIDAIYLSYISFAVPASTSPFTSAVIRIELEGVTGGPNALRIYDVSSDISSASWPNLYNDFSTGTNFGGISGLSTSNQTVDITLNASGLAAVNAARGGEISFGVENLPSTVGNFVFSGSDSSTVRQLILTPTAATTPPSTIPTMSEWAMILFGLSLAGGAALYIQRRRMIV
ncbi:IPTL-CTERM sorting domain-containing protein [Pseudomonas sp. ODNR1LW]|nr:IPTL-CTERM sorting domain-containing protein [Pseudomonas sp. ODNR1LW]